MKTRALLALAALLVGCGGGGSNTNISGGWSCRSATPSCVNWSTSAPVLGTSSGSTTMMLAISQKKGSDALTFDTQPTEGNGVAWNCPSASYDGTTLTFGACALTSGHCTSTVTPSLQIVEASGSEPLKMAWASYDYTWGGSSCTVGNGVKVTVQAFDLTLGGR